MKGVKWGILGTGNITKKLRKAIEESTTGALVAIASRNIETAEKWINEYSTTHQKVRFYYFLFSHFIYFNFKYLFKIL